MSNSNETEKLQEKFTAKKSEAGYVKKLFFGTGLSGIFLSLALTGASYFSPKTEIIKKYESEKKLIELINDRETYRGEAITPRQLYSAKDSLESDLETLRCSNNFIIESNKRNDYLRRLRIGFYSGLSLAVLSSLGAFVSDRIGKKYEKNLEELNRLNSIPKECVKAEKPELKCPY